jgi:hypothetical protein
MEKLHQSARQVTRMMLTPHEHDVVRRDERRGLILGRAMAMVAEEAERARALFAKQRA